MNEYFEYINEKVCKLHIYYSLCSIEVVLFSAEFVCLKSHLLPAIRSCEGKGLRARYLFYCMFVCLFGQRFLSNPRADSRQILHAGVASWVGTCLLPFWGSATPLGGKKRGNDMGVVSFVHRSATISVFLSDAKCSPICRAQTCAHSGAEPPRSAKGFLQAGPKSSKKFRIFHHFETLRHLRN